MTTIAILGTGRVASRLGPRLFSAGHEVVIGSRRDTAPDWFRPGLRLAPVLDAVRDAQIVINATPGSSSLERLSAMGDALSGKILVDVSNATARDEDGMPGPLSYPNSSLGERLQIALPEARVVKTLNTVLFLVMAAPGTLTVPPTVFLSGDSAAAKKTVFALLADLGWPADSILDLGGIRSARGPEALSLLLTDVIRARGLAPFAISITS